ATLASRVTAATRQGLAYKKLPRNLWPGFTIVGDVLAFMLVGTVIYWAHLGWNHPNQWEYFTVITLMPCLLISFYANAGLYRFATLAVWPRGMSTLVAISGMVFLGVVLLGFALKVSDHVSRVWAFATLPTSIGMIILIRGGLWFALRQSADTVFHRSVAIYGVGPQARQMIERSGAQGPCWHRIIGLFDDRQTRVPSKIGDYALAGDLDDLVQLVRRGLVQDVVVALPWSADERLVEVTGRLRELPVCIYLSFDLIGYRLPTHTTSVVAGTTALEITQAPFSGWNGVIKWIEDKVLATILLLLLSPLMGAIALAIKIDSRGPVFFRQKRHGFNNELIEILKFRTMYDARRDENGERLVSRDDPRVTRVGRFLRRTSLDELPQILNVMHGEMSLVGPRPHPTMAKAGGRLYGEVVAKYAARHRVKPGITGWAQINGWRGETDTEEKIVKRVECDLYYIDRWSVWLDFRILVATVWTAVAGQNAY
ncbi:MAG: undecaprenyl-phosphate glucose phosphotransferase, partial [Pirellulales bacterium]|nr:undecaprenyl-phosphate glucose phosphotransferase [Pirellulales bacterium]